jgi:nucleoside 2-deoxyribosyltransferase
MKTVVLCGSRRFKPAIRKWGSALKKAGVVVYEPYLHSGQEEWESLSPEYKKFIALGLTHDHFYKIKMADIVFVYNEGGYSGNSTTLEIGYAMALGKTIYAYSDKDEELCRKVLFREIITEPKTLLERLK